jgi:flagellin
MRVRDNWLSLLSWRAFSTAAGGLDRSIARLSSGQRINVAADDASGLAISQRVRSQVNGLVQANRNAWDGLSLLQTAEGGLQEVSTILQRARELSVQAANETLSDQDRSQLQGEVSHLLSEIDRIADSVTYNNRRLFSTVQSSGAVWSVLAGLSGGWLGEAEKVIKDNYGLEGDGASLRVVLEQDGPDSAWISGTRDAATGHLDDIVLHINLQDFGGPAGTYGPLYDDRKIARVLTQVILARNSDVNLVDQWFVSGAADYISGRDELLESSILAASDPQEIIDAMNDVLTNTWVDDDKHRASAYVAVKYLDYLLKTYTSATLKDVMQELHRPGATLDDSLVATLGVTAQDFITGMFAPNGLAFMQGLALNDADVGAIGGGDASLVIPDGTTTSTQPLAGFQVVWPSLNTKQEFSLQIGANVGDTLTFSIPELSSYTLGLFAVDVKHRAQVAIDLFSRAIETISASRAQLGSLSNRLEHTIGANAASAEAGEATFSRIVDLDMALETTNLSRHQILIESSSAVMAQANTSRQNIMWLLKGMVGPAGLGRASPLGASG